MYILETINEIGKKRKNMYERCEIGKEEKETTKEKENKKGKKK